MPTLGGMIKHNLAEGTQPGTVVRLRGQGIQNLRGAGKGRLKELGGSSKKGRLFVTAEIFK